MAATCTSAAKFARPTYGALLLLFTFVCSAHSVPVLPDALCPQENIPSNQVQAWPSNIIRFKMNSNLTSDARREILKAMSMWENRMCDGIVFIPYHKQEEEQGHFVNFVPGERCCSNRGKTGSGRQDVYIDVTCVLDGTLADVIGTLIGNTHRTSTTATARNQEEQNNREKNVTSVRAGSSNTTNVTSIFSNVTRINGQEDGVYPASECPNSNVRHISGKVSGRTKHGHIYSPNYPMDYESDTECIWKIQVPHNAALRLKFGEFDTECLHDYLEIHHLDTAAGTITSLDRLCGHLTGRSHITSHLSVDTVILRFHTDVTYNRAGFNISYEFIENNHQCEVDNGGCSYKCETDSSGIGNCICQAGYRVNRSGTCRDINECRTSSHGCEQNCRNTKGSYHCFCNEGYALHIGKKYCDRCEEVFNTTHGFIRSTGFPGRYPDHQNCLYTINVQPAHVLKLTLFVDINHTPECKKEFLKMEHGHFKHHRRLCGFINHVSYYIKDSNVTSTTLRFRTRNLNSLSIHPSGGINVTYEQVLRSSVSEAELNTVQVGSSTVLHSIRPWIEIH